MAVVLKTGRYFSYFYDLAIYQKSIAAYSNTHPPSKIPNLQCNDRGNPARLLARYRTV